MSKTITRLRNFKFNEQTYNNLAWLAQQDAVSVANKVNIAGKELVEKEAKKLGIKVDEIPWVLDGDGRVRK